MLDKGCPHCGGKLAVGAIACFRCGRLLVDDRGGTGHSKSESRFIQTRLGTGALAAQLDGRWLLKEPIGKGTSAIVWRAHDTSLDRPVAVKLLEAELKSDALAVARFEREGRLLARLEHKNVIMLLASGAHEGVPFLVLKLMQGRTLAEHLHARGGSLPIAEAAALATQLCEAVEVLHQAGVVHRDLQPRHIDIDSGGLVTLLDLGIAREEGSQLTRAGELLGEVGYRAPEVTRGEAPSPRADVYSLGCLLYEMVAGRPAFAGDLSVILMAGQRPDASPKLEVLVPGIAPDFAAAVNAAMATEPAARTASAEALRLSLLPFIASGAPAPVAAVPLVPVLAKPLYSPLPIREQVTAKDVDVTPSKPRESVTDPTPVVASPGETVVDEEPSPMRANPGATVVDDASSPMRANPGETMVDEPSVPPTAASDGTRLVPLPVALREPPDPQATRAFSALELSPSRPVTLTREYPAVQPGPHQQVRQRRLRLMWFTVSCVACVSLGMLVWFSSKEQPPLPATRIPRPTGEMGAMVAPEPIDNKEERIVALSPELEARREAVPVVDPGREAVSLHPKLRSGKAVAPWRIARKSRGGLHVGSTAEVVFDAVFKKKPVHAQLEVDGVWRGVTPVTLDLPPGDHALRLDAAGTALTLVTLAFSKGEHVKLEIELRTREEAAMRSDPPMKGAKPE